jgi:hypothetical protein
MQRASIKEAVMRLMPWKAETAGAALIVTTVYAGAQMGSGQMPQGPMPPEQMMGMMKQMSQMMNRCSTMMQGGPHHRRDAPATPEKKGSAGQYIAAMGVVTPTSR